MKRLVPLLLLLFACNARESENDSADGLSSVVADTTQNVHKKVPETLAFDTITVDNSFSYQLFESEHGGYGYRIFQDGKLYVNQPHIPAVQGREGFSSESDATETALYAIAKLQHGVFPPTLSVSELDSLGVLK